MSTEVTSPTGQLYTVAADNTVYDADNVAIGHVDPTAGSFVDHAGNQVSLVDLASEGYVFPDGFELTPATAQLTDANAATNSGTLPTTGEPAGIASAGAAHTLDEFATRAADLVAFTQLAADPSTTEADARAFLHERVISAPNELADVSRTAQVIADVLATNPTLARAVEEMASAHLVDDSRPLADIMAELPPAHRVIAQCAYLDICSGGGNAEYLQGLKNFAGAPVFSEPGFPSEANERGYTVGYVVDARGNPGAHTAIRRADAMDGVAELGEGRVVGHVCGPTDGHAALITPGAGIMPIMYVTPESWPAEQVQVFQRAYQMILENNTNYTQTIALNFGVQGLAAEGVSGDALASFMAARGFALPEGGAAELSALLDDPPLFSFDDYANPNHENGLLQLCGRSTASNIYAPSEGEPPLGFENEAQWYRREMGCSTMLAQCLFIAEQYPTWDAYVAAFSSSDTPPISEQQLARLDNYSPNDILILGARGGEFVFSDVDEHPDGLVLGENTQLWMDSYDDFAAHTQRDADTAIADWLSRAGGFSAFAFSVLTTPAASSDPSTGGPSATRDPAALLDWRADTVSRSLAQAGVSVSPATLRALFALMESPGGLTP